MTIILALGLLLLGGYWFGRLARVFGLPAVSGYIVAGLVLGPHGLFHYLWPFTQWFPAGFIPVKLIDQLGPVTDLVLAVVALSIGAEIRWDNLRRRGVGIVVVVLLSSLGASALVFAGLYGLAGVSLVTALIVSAIASATAPAATLAVLREMRAKGPLTETILAVVAIDDAVALILYSLAAALANALSPGSGAPGFAHLLGEAAWEIGGSLVLGIAMGSLMIAMAGKIRQRGNQIAVTLGASFVTSGLAMTLHFSPLLSNMVAGAFIASTSRRAVRIFGALQEVEAPLYIAFFALAGTHLRFDLLGKAGFIGLVYVVTRALGKIAGAWLGCRIAKSPPKVQRYLGLGLLPQAGVAIGLVFAARRLVGPADADLMMTLILATVAVNEILGPPLTKLAVTGCGEQDEAKTPRDFTISHT